LLASIFYFGFDDISISTGIFTLFFNILLGLDEFLLNVSFCFPFLTEFPEYIMHCHSL